MLTILICLLLVAVTIIVHYEALRYASARLTHLHLPPRFRIIIMLVVALTSHVLQILIYACVFLWLENTGGFGSIDGDRGHDLGDAFYFSITSYTTLGIGDLYPLGAFRIISCVEALNGLVMVGWTASMTYLYMEKFWHLAPKSKERRNTK